MAGNGISQGSFKMKDKDKTTQDTQIYLEIFIPEAMSQIMESYNNFLEKTGETKEVVEIKNFLEFHKACKAAISNIENILKLYQWVDKEESLGCTPEDIQRKIDEAEQTIKSHLDKIPSE